MAETTMRGPKWYRYNYTAYDKSKIPAAGELRFFNTILTGITHPCSVIGDGATAVSGLPFREIININAGANINLEVLRIAGNFVLVRNTSVGNINVNVGTAGVPNNYVLATTRYLFLQFHGTAWHFIPKEITALYVNGDLTMPAATIESRSIQIGHGRTGDGYAFIDFIGDATYPDYGLRLIRGNTGANATSQLEHKGTGGLYIRAIEAATIILATSSTNRIVILPTGEVGIGTNTPTLMFSVTEKTGFSPLGGTCIKVTNKTGGNTVAGRLVKTSTANDDAVVYTAIGDTECIGVFLESGIADGSEAWVVVGGIADVMLDDNVAAVHGNWMGTGAGAGYARTQASPAAAPQHFEEIGHCLESVAATGAGTHILARCVLHFL